ncbi:TlpA family protein disulfide reductase [Agromyces silvae]|uniref:TlpA family protein disulfide reductase n=1 Tax=Agromyces silvae TaxID=3388266 RepID=UPI00280C281C|nr:thioredoxin family protein [Agromyces protaetiae]
MDWPLAIAAAAGLVAVATATGLLVRARTGRVRAQPTASASDTAHGETHALGLTSEQLGDAVTLVQFSTRFCSQCPGTARTLGALARDYRGVAHVEVDLTDDRTLAERFRVLQTPTTLVLDRHGTAVARIAGPPRTHELRAVLDALTTSTT